MNEDNLTEVNITSAHELDDFIRNNSGCIVYFSHDDCNVCKELKPKVKNLIKSEFEKLKFGYVNVINFRELAAQNSIFAVPTIVIYFANREMFRLSRHISIDELCEKLERPYAMIFD